MTTHSLHTPNGHASDTALRLEGNTPSGLLSPHSTGISLSGGQTIPSFPKASPVTADVSAATTTTTTTATTTTATTTSAATTSRHSPSPNYFDMIPEHPGNGSSSVMDIDNWRSSSSVQPFPSNFHSSSVFGRNSIAAPSAEEMTTLRLSRSSLPHNGHPSHSSTVQRRPLMPRFNSSPDPAALNGAAIATSAIGNGFSLSKKPIAEIPSQSHSSISTSSSTMTTTTTAITTTTTATMTLKLPRSAMPSFACKTSAVSPLSSSPAQYRPQHEPAAAPTPMDIDPSPFFANHASSMKLELPPGRGFSKESTAKPKPKMQISLPPMPQSRPPVKGQPLSKSTTKPLSLKLNIGGISSSAGAGISSAVSRGTPISAMGSGRLFPPADMLQCDKLKGLIAADDTKILILDVRCAQSYAMSHVQGALNLCVPTMLLKRDNFKLQKVLESFHKADDISKLARWREVQTIVAYGTCSSDKNEVSMASNVLRKFTKEGFQGSTYVLSGGFASFIDEYPDFVDEDDAACTDEPATPPASALPVMGGVVIPQGNDPVAPFFATIRQNMDLAGGVGQQALKRPTGIELRRLPEWLAKASEPANEGKDVSEKFLNIEVDEKNRMKAALTMNRPGMPANENKIRLSGIEKGGKNRYKDILPFDHARVKLHGKTECDYINASHVKSTRSNKRYIASQGPLPGTCDDFWSVVWDQDVRVVVNLTAEAERGVSKCHAYWKEGRYGSITIKMASETKISLDLDPQPSEPKTGRARANTTMSFESNPSPTTATTEEQAYVTVRYFAISHAAFPWLPLRQIVQLHYAGWPDFGAPAQPSHLLALVELANIMQRQYSHPDTSASIDSAGAWQDEIETEPFPRPMLVHCSAGCGRTGTFCTVDSVIDMMKRQRLTSLDALAGLSPADTAATTVAASMGINAPNSPRSTAVATRNMAYVINSPINRQRSASSSRRGSSLIPPVMYPPLDIEWMNDESIDLVRATVDDFRRQRLSMVQTLKQYVLCYEAVMEWISRLHDHCSAGSVIGSRIRPRKGSIDGHMPA